MGNLAITYRALGRNQDALTLQEKQLESWRRVFPENHPEMGVIDFACWFHVRFDTFCFSICYAQSWSFLYGT